MIKVNPILTHCWRPKVCYPTIAAAETAVLEQERRNRQRGIQSGPLCIYFCPRHCNFHIGHERTIDHVR